MIFNDYDYRDLTTGIKVKFKRKDEKPLSVWEVANFINNFSTYYYKFEIIETIAIALNESIDPRNIFIFSKSFLLNNVYSELDIIDLSNSEIPYILSLGNMISMFPNDKLININFILKAYNEINEILKNAKIYKTVDSSYIIKCFNNIKHLPVGKEIKNLETECNVFISDLEDKNLKEKVKEVFKNIKKEYFEYGQSKIKIKSLFDLNINYKQISFLEDRSMYNLSAQEKKLFNTYFHKFFEVLSRLPRPVVGIYYKDENVIKILCKSHINKDQSNITSLDLKKFSHNSPPFMEFLAGQFITKASEYILSSEERALKKELLKQQINTEKLKQKTEEEKQKSEKLNRLEKRLTILEKLDNINKSNIPNNIKQVNNTYLKSQLLNIDSSIGNNLRQLLNKTKFDLIDEDIEHIHVDTYK